MLAERIVRKFPDAGAHAVGVGLELQILVEAFLCVGEVAAVGLLLEEILPEAILEIDN